MVWGGLGSFNGPDFMRTLCLSPLQAKIFGQSFMMSRLNVAVDDVANAEAEKKAQ